MGRGGSSGFKIIQGNTRLLKVRQEVNCNNPYNMYLSYITLVVFYYLMLSHQNMTQGGMKHPLLTPPFNGA